jgi:hypothetical protein
MRVAFSGPEAYCQQLTALQSKPLITATCIDIYPALALTSPIVALTTCYTHRTRASGAARTIPILSGAMDWMKFRARRSSTDVAGRGPAAYQQGKNWRYDGFRAQLVPFVPRASRKRLFSRVQRREEKIQIRARRARAVTREPAFPGSVRCDADRATLDRLPVRPRPTPRSGMVPRPPAPRARATAARRRCGRCLWRLGGPRRWRSAPPEGTS